MMLLRPFAPLLIAFFIGAAFAAEPATTSAPAFDPGTPPPASRPAPKYWSLALADTIMNRYPDYRKAYWKPWTYVQGYMFYGFEMLANSTGDQKYLDYTRRYIDNFVDDQGNLDKSISLTNLDNMMTGNTIVAMFERTKDTRYRKAADHIREAFNDYPRTSDGGFWHAKGLKGQMWIDGVFMGQMFLIRYGHSIGDSQYAFDEAAKQITVYARHGERDHSGLFIHGWTESPQTTKWVDPNGDGLSSEVWSEGLGWYALVTVETLAVLPKDHPRRPELEAILKRMAAGLKKVQDPTTGRWFDIVDKPDAPGNWTDTSGSAMFTYMFQRGIDLGLLDAAEYAPVAKRGYEGIIANARIGSDGGVDIYSACDGVSVQRDYDRYIHYKKKLNAKEAVAGFLWATAIMEKPGPGASNK